MKNKYYLLIALRPQQWIKNLFVLLPFVFGQRIFSFYYLKLAVLAFFLFSMISSSTYLMNDLFDRKKDILHPLKRLRPIASGHLSVTQAWLMSLILAFVSIASAYSMNAKFSLILVAYWWINIFYSRFLKDFVIVDVFCIGIFFLLRVVGGGVMAGVQLSHWLILMTFLLAAFLGFNKRRQELAVYGKRSLSYRSVLAQYNRYFIDQMTTVLTSSVVVMYTLYTVDSVTVHKFGTNHLIYSVPFVYYGVFRYLYLIHKSYRDGDPTRILMLDLPLKLNLGIWLLVCLYVIYGKI